MGPPPTGGASAVGASNPFARQAIPAYRPAPANF